MYFQPPRLPQLAIKDDLRVGPHGVLDLENDPVAQVVEAGPEAADKRVVCGWLVYGPGLATEYISCRAVGLKMR